MRKKILIAILSLAFIASIGVMLWWHYGIFTRYNYFTAKYDIKNGNVRFITVGLPQLTPKQKEIDSVAAKYGFTDCNLGCIVSKQELNAADAYNNVVEKYLIERNGKNWKNTYKKIADSLYKVASK